MTIDTTNMCSHLQRKLFGVDAAVDGYPMLHAKATKVAVRVIPDGIEYLFTAVDLPREGAPEMPVHEIQIYVTVANGEAPVFTQVIR